jgi:hypothetical protein
MCRWRAYSGIEPYIFVSYAHSDGRELFEQLSWLHEACYMTCWAHLPATRDTWFMKATATRFPLLR